MGIAAGAGASEAEEGLAWSRINRAAFEAATATSENLTATTAWRFWAIQ